MTSRWRWAVLSIFILSSALNYLDRSLLGAFTPSLISEFRVSATDFSIVVVVFSLIYAASAPLMGLLIDRTGLAWGTSLIVAGWSVFGMLTSMSNSLASLTLYRAGLGIFEAGGIPASSKTIASYLKPEERALGSAFSQVGLTIGASAAPQLAAYIGPRYGWPSAFLIGGVLGFLWIPIWLLTMRRVPTPVQPQRITPQPSFASVARDQRLWIIVLANLLAMTGYSLWTSWTTLFLVKQYALTQDAANQLYAWIPPIFATLGGFSGGFWALREVRRRQDPLPARLAIMRYAAIPLALTAITPFAPTPALATAGISACLFFTVTLSVNLYALPLDILPPERTAFAISLLTGAFGLINAIWSRLVGWFVDHSSFTPVAILSSLVPLLAIFVLHRGLRPRKA